MSIRGTEELEWSWNDEEHWYDANVKQTVFFIISSEELDRPPFDWSMWQDGDLLESGTDETVYGCRAAVADAFKAHFSKGN